MLVNQICKVLSMCSRTPSQKISEAHQKCKVSPDPHHLTLYLWGIVKSCVYAKQQLRLKPESLYDKKHKQMCQYYYVSTQQ